MIIVNIFFVTDHRAGFGIDLIIIFRGTYTEIHIIMAVIKFYIHIHCLRSTDACMGQSLLQSGVTADIRSGVRGRTAGRRTTRRCVTGTRIGCVVIHIFFYLQYITGFCINFVIIFRRAHMEIHFVYHHAIVVVIFDFQFCYIGFTDTGMCKRCFFGRFHTDIRAFIDRATLGHGRIIALARSIQQSNFLHAQRSQGFKRQRRIIANEFLNQSSFAFGNTILLSQGINLLVFR